MKKNVVNLTIAGFCVILICAFFVNKKRIKIIEEKEEKSKINIEMRLDNLVYNIKKIRESNTEDVPVVDKVIPVVKSNAYNFGVYDVVKTFLSMKKDPQTKFFVFSTDEGIELRKFFPQIERIYVIMGPIENDVELFKKYNLTPVVNSYYQLEICKKHNIKDIVLQFNTGMNRNGFEIKELKKLKSICDNEKFNVLMVMSHFACSDEEDSEVNTHQINEYKKIVEVFNDKKIIRSFPATFGILNFGTINGLVNSFRPGRLLYGFLPERGYDKNLFSIYVYLDVDEEGNVILPFGKDDGLYYGEGGYIVVDGEKIYVKSVESHKIVFDKKNKSLAGKKVYLLKDGMGYADGSEQVKRPFSFFFGRLFRSCDENKNLCKIKSSVSRERAKKDINLTPKSIFRTNEQNEYTKYETILFEKRVVNEDGIVGYNATKAVKKGEKLGVIFGGHADGFSQPMSNKGIFVYVENKYKKLIPCEFYGLISTDQITVKIPDEEFDNIEYGARVIVFDEKHSVKPFEEATGMSGKDLFFGLNKTYRVDKQ